MKATVIFGIGCRALCPQDRRPDGLSVERETTFGGIMQLTGCGPRGNPAYITVEVPLDHPNLPEALRVIRNETGRIPTPGRVRTNEDARNYFSALVSREYEDKDVRDLPYVEVQCNRRIADSRDPIQTDDERYLAKANTCLKARWEYGTLGRLSAYAMNTHLKNVLEQHGMKGFHPRLVVFDKPEKAVKELWQPWSDVMMPHCLLPLVDNVGEPTTPDGLADPIEYRDRPRDPGRGVHYYCGPYREVELCYSSAEVPALGGADIAIGRERVGATKRVAFRRVIISQRFRQALKKEKLPGMQYKPVRLLKKGDPLWENPFESMVGPYDEKPPVADR